MADNIDDIPAGYKWMLKYSETIGVDFDCFEDEFNLEAAGGVNNFDTIADAVHERYQHVEIHRRKFEDGVSKLEFVEKLIEQNFPCMLSLSGSLKGNSHHTVPVVSMDPEKVKVIWTGTPSGDQVIRKIDRQDIVNRHDEWPGGEDVAWYGGT